VKNPPTPKVKKVLLLTNLNSKFLKKKQKLRQRQNQKN